MYERYTRKSLEASGTPEATINAVLEAQDVADELNYEPQPDKGEQVEILAEALLYIKSRYLSTSPFDGHDAYGVAINALEKAGLC